jgi:rod shape-determining protein MreC
MAWYGRRRSGEQRIGARAVIVGFGLAMLGVLAIQTSTVVRSGVAASRTSMDGATASIAGFASNIASWQVGFGTDPKSRTEIEQLRAEVLDLQQWKDMAETMSMRMERYEELLDLIGETQGKGVTARVVAETDGPFAATRIANAGSVHGVQEGWAAINENGLVGRVVRVGPRTSRILLLSDYNSRIPVMGGQSQDRAMLVGDRGEGARLQNAETPGEIVSGEIWYTSGDDGQLPPGVKVGRARLDGSEWRIDLAMMDGHVDFVRLVPPPDIPRPDDAPLVPAPAASPSPGAPAAAATAPAAARPSPRPTAARTTPAPRPAGAATTAAPPASPAASPAPGQGGGR